MKIRMAAPSDVAEIKACEDLAFDLSARPGNMIDAGQSAVMAAQIDEGQVHVIQESARILGYISFSSCFDHLFVDTIAVLPDHHRKGLGSRLLTHAEEAAADRGLGSVKLFTDGTISGNVLFYQRLGYLETDRCEEGDFSRIFYSKAVA